MDKFQFMKVVAEILENTETDEETDAKAEEMIKTICAFRSQTVNYRKAGILK